MHIKAAKEEQIHKWMIVFFLSMTPLMAIEVPSGSMKERNELFMKRKALEQGDYKTREESLKEGQRAKPNSLLQERMEMRKKIYPRGTIETH